MKPFNLKTYASKFACYFCFLFVFVGTAGAADFLVNSSIDAPDQSTADGVCKTAAGTCTLRAAIQQANVTPSKDRIILPNGTFRIGIPGDGEDSGATGDFDITAPLEIVGAGIEKTIIDGVYLDRIFHVFGGSFDLKVSDLTIRNGKSSSGGGILFLNSGDTLTLDSVRFVRNKADAGGAVLSLGGLSLQDCEIRDNTTSSSAGAVYVSSSLPTKVAASDFINNSSAGVAGAMLVIGNGSLTITDSQFNNNKNGGDGGAVYASLGLAAKLQVDDSGFVGNSSLSGNGGALVYSGNGDVEVIRSNFKENMAQVGGALLVTSSGTLRMSDCSFTDNSSISVGGAVYLGVLRSELVGSFFSGNVSGGPGGALYSSVSNDVDLTDLTALDNISVGGGGAFLLNSGGSINIAGSKIVNNSTTVGPGGGGYLVASAAVSIVDSTIDRNYNSDAPGGGLFINAANPINVSASTFSNNTAAGAGIGGGLFFSTGGGSSEIRNSTFSANSTDQSGGAIYAASGLRLINSTLAFNKAAVSGATVFSSSSTQLFNTILNKAVSSDHCFGAFSASGGGNLSDDASCPLAAPTDKSGDAALVALANNGGPTETHKIAIGSAALDGVASSLTCPAVDQRGVARPFDGDLDGVALCDIGAFESRDACPFDPNKEAPGICGCGVADLDANNNGIIDCLATQDLKAQALNLRSKVARIKKNLKGKKLRERKVEITRLTREFTKFANQQLANLQGSVGTFSVRKDITPVVRAVRTVLKVSSSNFAKNKKNARKRLDQLIKKLK